MNILGEVENEKKSDLFASNDAHKKNSETVRSEQISLFKFIQDKYVE